MKGKCPFHIDRERIKESALPFFASLLFSFAAHMFILVNKIPMDDDICNMFSKGATVVSGRWGLEILRLIMPDISMPWIYGVMAIVLLSLSVCLIVRLFGIRSKLLQVLVAGVIVTFPAQTGTMVYMFTCAPYGLSMLLAVGAVYCFNSGNRLRWVISPLLLIFSCSIYQGYFAFAASFCVLLMIKMLLDGEGTAGDVFLSGVKMLLFLVLSVGIYAGTVMLASALAGIPTLDVVNREQGILMRILVAYSAYLHTLFSGYFAYVGTAASRVLHIVIIGLSAVVCMIRMRKTADIKKWALLALCLVLFPLGCYCLYMLADNSYIHSLALFPFSSIYILAAVILDGVRPEKERLCRWAACICLGGIILGNVYFSNSFYLYGLLQYQSRQSFYTAMLTQVFSAEGFDENTGLAIIGESAALDHDLGQHMDFSKFQLPGNSIMNPIHAKDFINNYLGCDIPFASEEECAAISCTDEFGEMSVYPYYGSVKKIGDYVIVRLD